MAARYSGETPSPDVTAASSGASVANSSTVLAWPLRTASNSAVAPSRFLARNAASASAPPARIADRRRAATARCPAFAARCTFFY